MFCFFLEVTIILTIKFFVLCFLLIINTTYIHMYSYIRLVLSSTIQRLKSRWKMEAGHFDSIIYAQGGRFAGKSMKLIRLQMKLCTVINLVYYKYKCILNRIWIWTFNHKFCYQACFSNLLLLSTRFCAAHFVKICISVAGIKCTARCYPCHLNS